MIIKTPHALHTSVKKNNPIKAIIALSLQKALW